MPCIPRRYVAPPSPFEMKRSFAGLLLLVLAGGCGGSTPPTLVATTHAGPQTYFSPLVEGSTVAGGVAGVNVTYTIDDVGDAFSLSTFALNSNQKGFQVADAGFIAPGARGLLELGLLASYQFNSSGQSVATTYTRQQNQPGGFALELANQAGGLAQFVGEPVTPLVPTTSECPSIGTAKTYLFVTIPGALRNSNATVLPLTWDPLKETAYGSVDISTDGSTVKLANIKHSLLPSSGGSLQPANPTSVAGACGQSIYGNTISIPGEVSVLNPGQGQTNPTQAIAGISPSGLLVEDNGTHLASTGLSLDYLSALGAGTGAIGLPRPSTALDLTALTGAQYMGFIYGAGTSGANTSTPTGWSSHLASFGGFSSVPSTCPAGTSNPIYGGSFTGDDPSTSSNGFGLCNVTIELGAQDPSNPGLFPTARVSIGATYVANTTRATDSFSAVAIAGQLNGKFAIFVLGVDSTQPWEIDLLQSN